MFFCLPLLKGTQLNNKQLTIIALSQSLHEPASNYILYIVERKMKY